MRNVKAKFKLVNFETTQQARYAKGPDGQPDYKQQPEMVEMRSLRFSPVYSEDPSSENAKFWNATPAGHIDLGVVNPEAWQHFELGQEYFVEFTPADG